MDLIKKDLIYRTMFELHTKFIEAENEYKCGKVQVSLILPDTMEMGRGARVCQDVGIKNSLMRPRPLLHLKMPLIHVRHFTYSGGMKSSDQSIRALATCFQAPTFAESLRRAEIRYGKRWSRWVPTACSTHLPLTSLATLYCYVNVK
jgi:hypothetical protein